jgi:hypothetical protein
MFGFAPAQAGGTAGHSNENRQYVEIIDVHRIVPENISLQFQ